MGGGKMKPAMELKRDSRVIAARVAMDQLEAMGCARFDVGVKRIDGAMLLREGWGAKQVLKSLLWLRRENLNRGHIYVRPSGVHGLSLVDDLKAGAIARMKGEGFEPAAIVETSPGNFQAWLKHTQSLNEAASTRAAKMLAVRFGGDLGSADWRHFGRLAGFTNPKPERRLETGLQPFARLIEASGRVYSRAAAFIAEVRAAMTESEAVIETGDAGDGVGQGGPELAPLRALDEFHRDPRYGGDLHRADMAWARHAAAMGLGSAEIRAALIQARDLSKKGSEKRQREYAERTAEKAVRQTTE
jgi:RepB DNA-primase N-terminal domain/RepB DNA-primase C-terminal helical domain